MSLTYQRQSKRPGKRTTKKKKENQRRREGVRERKANYAHKLLSRHLEVRKLISPARNQEGNTE
jgi:hypothetical protein